MKRINDVKADRAAAYQVLTIPLSIVVFLAGRYMAIFWILGACGVLYGFISMILADKGIDMRKKDLVVFFVAAIAQGVSLIILDGSWSWATPGWGSLLVYVADPVLTALIIYAFGIKSVR